MTRTSTSVLVASRDGDYRRLASAALAGAGFEVRTVVARAERVERMVAERRPDVLVLDASPASVAQIDTYIGALEQPPAMVVVAELGRGRADYTDKWCSTAELVQVVARAARRPAARRLRLVR